MNTIVVLLDSLNFHCLEPYGARHVRTPNLARFAERACVFDNHFAGSMPCMPARRELFSGRQEFLWRGWGPMEPWDRHLATDAARVGAVTQMVTDHYHYWENAAHGYFEPFHGVELIRGHELDPWRTDPVSADIPEWARNIDRFRNRPSRNFAGQGSSFLANARQWRDESDFPCAQVMRTSADWLQRNRSHEKFLLWVEAFDPHEPHYLPEPYRTLYAKSAPPNFNCWPPYQDSQQMRAFLAEATDQHLDWIRAQYYGKVTMVDRWLGELFNRLDTLNLWDRTAVIVTTDHGHDLCYDRTLFPHPWAKSWPHPESHARIPLLVWHPDHPGRGRRVQALTTAVDVNATVREIVGAEAPNGPHGRSLMPLIRNETAAHRDWVLYGTFGAGAVISSREWTLAQGATGAEPCFWYSTTAQRVSTDMTSGLFIPGVTVPQWRVPCSKTSLESFLWNRSEFTLVPQNRIGDCPDPLRNMRALLADAIRETGAPPETFRRLGLESAGAR